MDELSNRGLEEEPRRQTLQDRALWGNLFGSSSSETSLAALETWRERQAADAQTIGAVTLTEEIIGPTEPAQ